MTDLKKTGFSLGVMSLVAVLALVGTGCGSGNGFARTPETQTAVQGRWIKTGLALENRVVSCSNSLNENPEQTVSDLTDNNVVVESCGFDERIQFNSNRTYQITVPPPRLIRLSTESGTYSVSGDTVTLTRTDVGYDTNGDGTVAPEEVTRLTPVTDPNNIPSQPVQRAVLRVELLGNELRLTSVPQAVNDANGRRIVNGDRSVNASATGVTSIYTAAPN